MRPFAQFLAARWRKLPLVAAILAVLIAAGCGGDSQTIGEALAPEDPGPIHVHALDVNPSDGALFLATHAGLYRVALETGEGERVTDRRPDLMGFAVVGEDRFLASGHPDLRDDLPSHLGLIESDDAGESWRSLSLSGEADLHVIRDHPSGLYAYDSNGERLMFSDDAGANWSARRVPEALLDLVVDPENGEHLMATGESGLHRSRDGGRSWIFELELPGLLAWPEPDVVYLADLPTGRILLSTDAFSSFRPVGGLDAEPTALTAIDALNLYAALHGQGVVHSTDGGVSWSVLWEFEPPRITTTP